jgi:hypothetical protein
MGMIKNTSMKFYEIAEAPQFWRLAWLRHSFEGNWKSPSQYKASLKRKKKELRDLAHHRACVPENVPLTGQKKFTHRWMHAVSQKRFASLHFRASYTGESRAKCLACRTNQRNDRLVGLGVIYFEKRDLPDSSQNC